MPTMGRIVKNRESNVRGFSLQWQSKQSSSKRTVAIANLMHEIQRDLPVKNRTNVRRQGKKQHSTLNAAHNIMSNPEKCVPFHLADGTNFPSNPNLDLYTTEHTAVHWVDREEGVFSTFVIPRDKMLQSVNSKNTSNVVRALERLQSTEKSCNRSTNKTGTSTSWSKYTSFGHRIHRGGHGFVNDRLSKIDPHAAQTLEKWAKRMEHVTAEFLPSKLLRGISKANGFSAWPTTGKCKFVSAMASSVNYSAPAHLDDDFLFSIHQLNVEGALESDNIVQCMFFPTYGFAVGLRPGDIILFNPHVHHCLSEKTEMYIKDNVHVTTFYVKTAHGSKNNNSIPLSDEESIYYNMDFTH
eukprot:scaffold85866_cov55-Attheya_sp.AAC.5